MARTRISKSTLRVGDVIEVTIKGTVRELTSDHGCVHIKCDDGWNHYVYVQSASVTGTATTPFKPKSGEVYRVGSANWLCVSNGPYSTKLTMVSPTDTRLTVDEFLRSYEGSFKKVF